MATSGVVLVVLTVSGLRTWWPMQRYRRTALSSHWRTQRLSRDTDLFKAAGLVLLPLLFLWGYYASVFSIRPTQPASPVSMTGYQSPVEPTSTGQDQDIGPHRAVAAAQEAGGGQAVACSSLNRATRRRHTRSGSRKENGSPLGSPTTASQ